MSISLSLKKPSLVVCLRRPQLTDLLSVPFLPSSFSPLKNSSCDLAQYIIQSMLFDEESLRQAVTTAVDMMWLIEASPAQTVAEVKEQEQIYSNLRQKLIDKYSLLAHLVSATYFGLAIDSALWKPLADYATGRGGIMLAQFDTWLQAAADLSGEHLFFHWELEMLTRQIGSSL